MYLTPKEDISYETVKCNKENKSKQANLASVYREGFKAEMESELADGSKFDSKVVNTGEPEVTDLGRDSKESQQPRKTVSETLSASGKGLVDWFDYEPAVKEASSKLEEKKLKTKKRLDSASMTLIESEIETSKVDLKGKGKKEREKKKTKTDDTLKSEQEKGSLKGSINKVDTISAPNLTVKGKEDDKSNYLKKYRKSYNAAASSDVVNPAEDCSFSSSDKLEVKETSDQAEEVIEDWDKGFSNVVEMNTAIENENIDWWGAGGGEEPASVTDSQDLRGPSDIFIDYGPDVIIEDEFEEDIVETSVVEGKSLDNCVEDTDRVNNPESSPVIYKSEEDDSKPYQQDMLTIDVDNNWESEDDDDFELNGMPGCDTEFPGHSNTVVYTEEVPDRPVSQGRWVPGERRCYNCHDVGHTTDRCPKGVFILQ